MTYNPDLRTDVDFSGKTRPYSGREVEGELILPCFTVGGLTSMLDDNGAVQAFTQFNTRQIVKGVSTKKAIKYFGAS